ncbi:hypothetical protein SEVIR_1G364651v4 [Setaria viridis]
MGRRFSVVLLLVISNPIRVEIPPLPLRPAGTFYATVRLVSSVGGAQRRRPASEESTKRREMPHRAPPMDGVAVIHCLIGVSQVLVNAISAFPRLLLVCFP